MNYAYKDDIVLFSYLQSECLSSAWGYFFYLLSTYFWGSLYLEPEVLGQSQQAPAGGLEFLLFLTDGSIGGVLPELDFSLRGTLQGTPGHQNSHQLIVQTWAARTLQRGSQLVWSWKAK